MSDIAPITVEVVHALPKRADRIVLRLAYGTTVAQALADPQVLARCPEAATLPVGIFGRRCESDRPLRDGDRIELYRPLVADPKEARRERAAKA